MTGQIHHTAVFGNSKLPPGLEIENLRRRRAGLVARHREALLDVEAAVVALGKAETASRRAAGRELASLGSTGDVRRATATLKKATTARDTATRRAEEVLAGIGAVEDEMTMLLTAHRGALVEERVEAYRAAEAATYEAGEALRRALALLRVEAVSYSVLLSAVGEDTAAAPDAQRLTALDRQVAGLLAGGVPALREAPVAAAA